MKRASRLVDLDGLLKVGGADDGAGGVLGPDLLGLGVLLGHAAEDHGAGGEGLELGRGGEGEELLVVPLAGGDVAALGVGEHGLVLGAQEVGDGVAVLGGVEGHDAVDARLHRVAGREPERVADVDDGHAVPGLDEAELLGSRGPHLEAPLLGEEEGERADVGVLLVADVLGRRLRRDVVHHGQRARRRPVVAVRVLEARCAGQAEARREGGQDRLGRDVGPRDRVLQHLHVRARLQHGRQVRAVLLDLVARHLDHLVAVLGVLEDAGAGADGLVSVFPTPFVSDGHTKWLFVSC